MFLDFSLFRIHLLYSWFSIFIGELELDNFSGALLMLYFDWSKDNRDFDWDFLFIHSLWKHIVFKIREEHND